MKQPTLNRVLRYIGATFDASQEALCAGRACEFRELVEQHAALAELYIHLRDGGRVH